jgi:hypothetical protein
MKLHGLLITKDDDLLVEHWFSENHAIFDTIVIVDGSVSEFTHHVSRQYKNTIYLKDPTTTHITDQTLRHHGWQELKKIANRGDWVFICHVDEFYIHNPRLFMTVPGNVMCWLPLPILPHPSEAQNWILSKDKNPRQLFHHYWWRHDILPHIEHRMFRYIKDPVWNIDITTPSCGTIPHNYADEQNCEITPLYYHYKCQDLSLGAYKEDGSFVKSSLTTGIDRPVQCFEDLFFDKERPFDNYTCFDRDHVNILTRFGNPPRFHITKDGTIEIINDKKEAIHKIWYQVS